MSKSALMLSPCIAWAYPTVPWYDEDKVDRTDTTKRDNGILLHRQADHYLKGRPTDGNLPQEVDTYLQHCLVYLTDVLLPDCKSVQSEVAIGTDWLLGKTVLLSNVTDRKYPSGSEWESYQFGTADLVAELKDGTLLVADWKTGGSEGATEQLMSLAFGFSQLNPGKPVRISCLSVNEHGVWPKEADVSQEQLDSHWDDMRYQWEAVLNGRRTDHVTGVHCTTLYCPHLSYCSAIQDVVRGMAETAPQGGSGPMVKPEAYGVPAPKAFMSDKEAGETMAAVSAANRQIKYLTNLMKERVSKGLGKVLSGNYEWADGGNGFRWRAVNHD